VTDDLDPSPYREERGRRRRRRAVVAVSSIAIFVFDAAIINFLIPWVDRQSWSITRFGTMGYVVFFFTVLFTFIASLILVAYYFGRSSYPSDKWQ